MNHDDAAALLAELAEISTSLKDLVNRLIAQDSDFKALISLLEKKGILTPGELHHTDPEPPTQPGLARPATPDSPKPGHPGTGPSSQQRCRPTKARARHKC